MEKEPRKIYAFDFDGTLIKSDSFLPFLHHAAGSARIAASALRCAPGLIWGKLRPSARPRPKERLFRSLFRGMPREQFDDACARFASEIALRESPIACRRLREAVERGHTVYIISASPAAWIRPWAALMGVPADHVIATELMPDRNGCLDGGFDGGFCTGPEKVRRLLQAEPDRENYHLTVYSDGPGDAELIALADRAFVSRGI